MCNTDGIYSYEASRFSHVFLLLAIIKKQVNGFHFSCLCMLWKYGNKKPFKHLSKGHQRRLKKELETLILSADPSTNPNWDRTSGGNSSLESEWRTLDSNSETVLASSESNFDRYLDVNENNSVVLDISHFCLVFISWRSDCIPTRKYHGVSSEEFL